MLKKPEILLVHPNFPGQFKYVAGQLVREGFSVSALCADAECADGVHVHKYSLTRGSSRDIHPWLIDFETKIIRAQAAHKKALELKAAGYAPDIIWAHHAWGESLFLKEVWPNARLLLYCEFYYHSEGKDVGFDVEFAQNDPEVNCKFKIKNLINDLHFDLADGAISPTYWQKSVFPEKFQEKITVIHEGVNTRALVPDASAHIRIQKSSGQELVLTRKDRVLTFVNRNLEPYRGYHIFMRALPLIQQLLPDTHIVIIGGDDRGYGAIPGDGRKWKEVFLEEVHANLDMSKVHFVGRVSYGLYQQILQLSKTHVYLTYPFVLSWSLIEAMSVGCPIVASSTAPIQEVIQDNVNGRLVDFFDVKGLANAVVALLSDSKEQLRLGSNARELAMSEYDLALTLSKQVAWVKSFIK